VSVKVSVKIAINVTDSLILYPIKALFLGVSREVVSEGGFGTNLLIKPFSSWYQLNCPKICLSICLF